VASDSADAETVKPAGVVLSSTTRSSPANTTFGFPSRL
jgi:hypothetical protein